MATELALRFGAAHRMMGRLYVLGGVVPAGIWA